MQRRQLTSRAETLAAMVESQAATYDAELRGAAVRSRLTRSSLRPFSELYEFTLSGGTAALSLLVKLPFPNRLSPPTAADRPRLYSPVSPELLASLEYATMRHIKQSFTQLDDSSFGYVRVLDLMRDPDAIVMEKVEGTTLRATTAASSASLGDDRSNALALQTVGKWLRHFHQLPDLPHTKPRSTTREDFNAMTERFASYFPTVHAPRWMRSVGDFLIRESESTLPSVLPLGLAHGDFAPRNVIVSPGGRVTVIDTLARWRAPIYEDLGLFLLSLQLSRRSVALLTSSSIRRQQPSHAFLRGYFGDTTSEWPVLRMFVLQALLDRGCSYISASSNQSPVAAVKRRSKLHILKRIADFYMSAKSL